jgi:hypothetical protein
MSQPVFGRVLLRILFTNVFFCDARMIEMDYYLPLRLAYSQLSQVICLLSLTLLMVK